MDFLKEIPSVFKGSKQVDKLKDVLTHVDTATATGHNKRKIQTMMNRITNTNRKNNKLKLEYLKKLAETVDQQLNARGKTAKKPVKVITKSSIRFVDKLPGTEAKALESVEESNGENTPPGMTEAKKEESTNNLLKFFDDLPVEKKPEAEVEKPVEVKEVNNKENGCLELFDPCTREPISDISVLEKRVRELRVEKTKSEDKRIDLPENIKTRLDLLLFILNNKERPDESILNYKLGGQTGQIFEAYWDILFSLGFVEGFEINNKFFMYNGSADGISSLDDEKMMQNPIQYLSLRGVNMGASGASDITFVYKEQTQTVQEDGCSYTPISMTKKPKFIFCSSKYYKEDKKKSIDKYDIQNIYTSAKNIKDYDFKIVLLVSDPVAVKDKIKSAVRQYIAEEAYEVFGITDLLNGMKKLYDFIHQKQVEFPLTNILLSNVLGVKEFIKPVLSLRLHQEIAVNKISKAIVEFHKNKVDYNKFLIGILPRGGKTYIAGGLISRLQPKRVVVLLGAKSETISQFTDELFLHYQDFNEYTVVDVLDTTQNFPIDPSKKYIFVMSVELYKDELSSRKLLQDLKGGATPADLFICDEAHLKQMTRKAVKAMEQGTIAKMGIDEEESIETDKQEENNYAFLDAKINKNVPVVYMTGTYIKPLTLFKIPAANTILWEYADIQAGKNISTQQEYFETNFGEHYKESISKLFSYGESFERIEELYKKFPELFLLSTNFTDEAKDAFSKEIQLNEGKRGFPTLLQLFRVKKDYDPTKINPSQWYTGFTDAHGMMRLINYLAPSSQKIQEIDGTPIKEVSSVMERIDKISQRLGDRLAFFTRSFVVHSQLWFLPHMQGHSLLKRMTALAGIIFKSAWYRKNFHVLAVSSSVKWDTIPGMKNNRIRIPYDEDENNGVFIVACPNNTMTLKKCIQKEEAEARNAGKGLIILAQNMLHLGISLNCVDIVTLLDTGEKVDERIQKMYRALTESTNKKGGFIVDMNYFRTVTSLTNYTIKSKEARQGEKSFVDTDIKKLFNTVLNTYSIDTDLPIYSISDNGDLEEGQIQKETVPELQKQLSFLRKGDGLVLSEVGDALDKNIDDVLSKEYTSILDEYLGEMADEKEKQTLRKQGNNVKEAEQNKNNTKKNSSKTKLDSLFPPEIQSDREKKKRAFIDIFKTTLKLSAFGTENKSLEDLVKNLQEDIEFRDLIFDTLVRRESVLSDENDELRKADLIDNIIIPGIQKMIEQNRRNSYSKMKEKVNSQTDKIDDVIKYIETHLTPKEKERHKYGEVFTPLTLVDEMLSKLPKEVWSDPDLKWLDPANGIGNFPIKALLGQDKGEFQYPGLLKGLEGKKNCKWIIENMLYMIDINGKNNRIARNLFEKICSGAKPNIEQIDKKNGFLAEKPLVFNGKTVEKFDVIMGNPPYNRGGINRADTRKIKKVVAYDGEKADKKETIWNKFIIQSFKKLKKNGYLLFINPIGWFHSGDYNDVRNILFNNQIDFIKIYKHDSQSVKEFSGSGKISVAYYLVENKLPYKNTIIQGTSGKREDVKLTKNSIILLNNSTIINKIIKKGVFWKENKDFKHISVPCVPGPNKQILGLYENGEIKVVKTLQTHIDSDKPKIIISGRNYPRVYYDKHGEYGLTGSGVNYWIGNDKNLKQIEMFLKTKLAAFLTKELKFRQDFVEFKYFPDATKLEIEKITDETLADYFGFTKEERDAIEATEYPKREYTFKEVTCAQLKGQKEESTEGGGSRNYTRKVRR